MSLIQIYFYINCSFVAKWVLEELSCVAILFFYTFIEMLNSLKNNSVTKKLFIIFCHRFPAILQSLHSVCLPGKTLLSVAAELFPIWVLPQFKFGHKLGSVTI